MTVGIALVAFVAAGCVAAGLPAPGGPAPADPKTDECHFQCEQVRMYIQGGIGNVAVLCDLEWLAGYCLGGGIFEDVVGGRPYEIVIADEVVSQVSGSYRVDNGPPTDFCGSAVTPLVPPGARITVWVDGPVWGAVSSCSDMSTGTIGEVGIIRR